MICIAARKKENGNGSILPGLGRDEIFFVGEGRERFENPLQCHPLVCDAK